MGVSGYVPRRASRAQHDEEVARLTQAAAVLSGQPVEEITVVTDPDDGQGTRIVADAADIR